ncbi:hypothetical protein BJ742DRAFT_797405 [Cladochytrium replicatum]|nr:hypothetical protein BJ742DRAFT_797405 [Cladochytrium replicatum]
MLVVATALVALAASASAGKLCDVARYPWPGQQPTFAIGQTTPPQRYTKLPGVTGALLLSGNIKILNGCTFQIVNMRVEGAFKDANMQWLGGSAVGSNDGFTLSDQQFFVAGNASAVVNDGPIFSLTQVGGREMSFYDFKVMSLYSWFENNAFATATLPAGDFTPPGIGEAPKAAAPGLPANAQALAAPICTACPGGGQAGGSTTPQGSTGGNSTTPGGSSSGTGSGTSQTTAAAASSTKGASATGAAAPSSAAHTFTTLVAAAFVAAIAFAF